MASGRSIVRGWRLVQAVACLAVVGRVLMAAPAAADVAVALAADPSPLAPGAVLTVTLTVTNTGGFDETGVSASLDVNAGALVLVPLTGPVPAGPVSITTGASENFVWTFSASGSAWLSFTATATTLVPGAASVSATAAQPAGVEAASTVSRDPAPVGGWIEAVLTITNTGGVDVLDVGPSIEFTSGGPLVEAIAGPSGVPSLSPGNSASFTWTLSVSGTGTLGLTLSASGRDALFAVPVGAAASGLTAELLQPASLTVSVFTMPYYIAAGAAYVVSITVTNTGGFVATGVVPSLEVNEGAAGPFTLFSPLSADIQPGSSTRFFGGLDTSAPGIVRFTVTAGGFDTGLLRAIDAAGSASSTVLSPAAISVTLFAGPSPIVAGSVLTVTLWVQNSGEEAAAVIPDLGVPFGAGLVAPRSGPDPVPTEVAGLNLVPFVWTFSVSGCGTVGFTASVSGYAMIVISPLSAWAASAPVTLKGDAWDPTDDVTAGAAVVAATSTGDAHGPHALCAADQADWFAINLLAGRAYELTTAGGVGDSYGELFSDASASAVLAFDDDSAGGNQFAIDVTPSSTGSRYLRIRTIPPGSDWSGVVSFREKLAATGAVAPSLQQVGRWVTVAMTVTNSGLADLTVPVPSATITAGNLELIAAPTGLPLVPAGASAGFVWTFSVSGAGPATVRLSVAGADAVTGHPVSAWTTVAVTGTDATTLAASVSVMPPSAPAGAWVAVVLTLTNTGGTAASGILPVLQANSGGALVDAIAGPSPAGPVALAPGVSQSFTWSYSVSGAGVVAWTATASGTDSITGATVSAAGSASLVAGAPATMVSAMASWPAIAVTGEVVTVVVTVTNTGGTDAVGAVPSLVPAGQVAALNGPLPAGPLAIPAGGAQSFSWTYSATGCGPLSFAGSVAAVDATTGAPLWTSASVTGSIKGDPFDPADDVATAGSWLVPGPGWSTHGPHALCTVDPADWYRVNLVRGSAYRFETTGGGDAFAEMFDDVAGTVVVASDDDGAGGFQSRIDVVPARSGTFWLRVRSTPAGSDWAGDVQHRHLLSSALAVSPATSVVGQVVEIILTVTNSGSADLSGATGSFAPGPGLALASAPAAVTVPAGGSASFTWTATVTAAGVMPLTATVNGLELATGRPLATFSTSSLAVLRPAALVASVTAMPDPAATGQWITVTATVTNTGDESASGVTPTLGFTQGGGLVAAIASPAGGVTLVAGQGTNFVWTYSASGAGAVGLSVTVAGTGAVTAAPVVFAAPVSFTVEDRATLVASLLATPSPAEIGQTVRVVLSVTNTGAFPVTGVMPAIEAVVGGSLATDVSGPVPAGPVTIPPASRAFFTWEYAITGAGTLVLSGTASGTAGGTGVPVRAAGTASISTAAGPVLAGWLTLTPAQPVMGQWVMAVLTVSNTGGVDVTGALPSVQVNRGFALLSSAGGPAPAGPVVLAAGTGTSFTWTFTVTGAGVIELTATATGADAWTGATRWAAASAGLATLRPAALVASVTAMPDPAATGQWITVTATVTNTGDESASGVTPTLGFTQGGGLVAAIASPAGGVTLVAGQGTNFVWTYSASGAGTVGLSVTAAGTGALTGNPAVGASSDAIAIQERTTLTASLLVSPAQAEIGTVARVVLSVTNTGAFPATGVMPAIEAVSGSGLALDLSGPLPTGPVTIPPAGRAFFTWTYSITGTGTIELSATAEGTAGGTGLPALIRTGGTIMTAAPPALFAVLALDPPVPVGGQTLTVILTATNSGGVDALGVLPALSIVRGASLLTLLSGPAPAGPVGLTAGGGAQTFIWTYAVNGGGDLAFSASAAGQDAWTGAAVLVAASAATLPLAPAALSGSLLVTSSSPPGFWTAGLATAVLTVVNDGDVDAVSVVPIASAYAGSALVGAVSGPSPAGPVTVPAHGAVAFTWTLSLTGEGWLGMSATATGADAVTAATTATTGSAGFAILSRGDLTIALSAPLSAREGEVFEVILDITNTGDDALAPLPPWLVPAESERVTVLTGPLGLPATLAPGATARVRWTLRALRGPLVTLGASASARRSADDTVASAGAGTAVSITDRFAGVPLAAWPNPVTGDAVTIAVGLPRPAERVSIEVYSSARLRVADAQWRFVRPGADAHLVLTGVRGWAPGIYSVRAVAFFDDGTRTVYDSINVRVSR